MATIDIQIQNPCDHLIMGENAYANMDSLTILPSSPISADNNVRVVRNGVELPRSGFLVVLDPSATDDFGTSPGMGLPTYKKIVLVLREKVFQPTYELSYHTYGEQCPRCHGTGYSDDPVLNSSGDVVTASHEALLAQSVEKIIITTLQTNGYHPWYGTGLRKLIGTKIGDFEVLEMQIKDMVRSSLINLKDVQTSLLQGGQNVSYTEIFGELLSVDASQDKADPSVVFVSVRYTNKQGTALNYTQLLQLSNFRYRG